MERYTAQKGLLREHYTPEVLFSPLARYCWVEPDLSRWKRPRSGFAAHGAFG